MPESVLEDEINYEINPRVQQWCLWVGGREEQKGRLVGWSPVLPLKQKGSFLICFSYWDCLRFQWGGGGSPLLPFFGYIGYCSKTIFTKFSCKEKGKRRMQNEGVASQRKTICGYGNVKHLRRKVIIPDVAINEM